MRSHQLEAAPSSSQLIGCRTAGRLLAAQRTECSPVHSRAAGSDAGSEQGIVGHAVGRGEQFLALSDLSAEQFDALLLGHDPTTQAELRTKATHGDSERAGWDCTLSPPKSISIQSLVCGDKRLLQVDRDAALYAIREVEACALPPRHGGPEGVGTGNVVAIMFNHSH